MSSDDIYEIVTDSFACSKGNLNIKPCADLSKISYFFFLCIPMIWRERERKKGGETMLKSFKENFQATDFYLYSQGILSPAWQYIRVRDWSGLLHSSFTRFIYPQILKYFSRHDYISRNKVSLAAEFLTTHLHPLLPTYISSRLWKLYIIMAFGSFSTPPNNLLQMSHFCHQYPVLLLLPWLELF